jgi:hypothetical protein
MGRDDIEHRVSPLETHRLVHDVLYAMSMWFAESLKRSLMQNSERVYIFACLLLLLIIQINIEKNLSYSYKPPLSAMREVWYHFVYTLSRTLAFLILNFSLSMLDSEAENVESFWLQSFFLPLVLIFFMACLAQMNTEQTKTTLTQASKDAEHDSGNY